MTTSTPTPTLIREPLMRAFYETRRSKNTTRDGRSHRRYRGLSLIELLLSLAISAMLLTATMVALDVSFKAYAIAAEQASTQAATRMITNRLLTLMRTSTAHGPLEAIVIAPPNPLPADGEGVQVSLVATRNDNLISTNFIDVLDSTNNIVRVAYDDVQGMLFLTITPPGGVPQTQPLLGGVTNAQFSCARRLNDDGIWVLNRGTMDLTVQSDTNATLAIENGNTPPIRVIASTMPRKIPR